MRYSASSTRMAMIGTVLAAVAAPGWADDTNLLLNGGAEEGKDSLPSIWFAASVPAEGLRIWRDTEHARSGKACLAITNRHKYDQQVSNNWAQDVQDVPAGKEVRLVASIRTEDADSANVCVQCWAKGGDKLLAFASTPVLRGSHDWIALKSQKIVVPPDTSSIIVRAAMTGVGTAFFDDLALQVAGEEPGEPKSSQDEQTRGPASVSRAELDALVPGRIVKTSPIVKDCMILAYLPTWNHGDVDNIAVANNDGGVRTLLDWEAIPAEMAGLANLRFLLAVYARETTFRAPAGRIAVYEIMKDWPERTAWENQPDVESKPIASLEMIDGGRNWRLIDLTDLLRQQARSGRPGHGAMLRFDAEKQSGDKNNWSGCAFVSREGLGEWKDRRPQLLVVDTGRTSSSRPSGTALRQRARSASRPAACVDR